MTTNLNSDPIARLKSRLIDSPNQVQLFRTRD